MQEGQSSPPAPAATRKSGRLGAAEARIEAALNRLDAALDGCVGALARRDETSGLVTRLQESNAALQQAHDSLSARLERALAQQDENAGLVTRLQTNNEALLQIRDNISARLDAAVERLRRVLAH